MCKNCYPKFLKHVLKNDAQKKLERDKLKDPEFERLLYAGLKNLQSLYSFYRKDFDQSIADVLITRKDKDGYFFERIAILLEQDDFTDLVYDLRNIFSTEFSLMDIRINLHTKGYSEYKREVQKQVNDELYQIFSQVVKFYKNITVLHDTFSETFADETFALRDYILKKMDDYERDYEYANIVYLLRKIVSHLYEMLYFMDALYV